MRIWRADKHEDSDGTTPFYILVEKVPFGFYLVLEQVAAMDVTTTCTSIRAGVWNHNRFIPFISHDTVVANELYYSDVTVRLRPPEQLAFEFIGTTQGDELKAYAFGCLVKREESYTVKGNWTGR